MAKKRSCPLSMRVQSVMFEKSKGWTPSKACSWLKKHDMTCKKIDVKAGGFHARQEPPKHFSFFRRKNWGKGIKPLYGCPKE